MVGRLAENGPAMLRDEVQKLLAEDEQQILLNLAEVPYANSTGIGALVSSFTTTKNRGGQLRMHSPGKKMTELLQLTQLYPVFDVRTDEADALRGFK